MNIKKRKTYPILEFKKICKSSKTKIDSKCYKQKNKATMLYFFCKFIPISNHHLLKT